MQPMETIDDILSQAIDGQDTQYDPTEWRLSEAAHPCDRYLVLKRTGAPGRNPDAKVRAYMARGRVAESWVAEVLTKHFRQRGRRVFRQLEIQHPWGTGHLDLWIPSERTAIEVKSVSPSELPNAPKDAHVSQLLLYLYFLSNRTNQNRGLSCSGYLLYLSLGRELAYRAIPVAPSTERAEELIRRIDRLDRMAQRGDVPPARFWPDEWPCSWRDADGDTHTCMFFDHCHSREAWDAPPRVAGDVVDRAAERWLIAKRREQEAKEEYEAAVQRRREIEREMVLPIVRNLGEEVVQGNQYRVTVREIAGRVTYDVDAAIRCGILDPDALAPFRRQGDPHHRVYVRELDGTEGRR